MIVTGEILCLVALAVLGGFSQKQSKMTYWREAGFTYLKYSNIAAKALRSVLKAEPKALAMKREEVLLRSAVWKEGKPGENKYVVKPAETK